jgi:hypothetical protein
MVGLSSQLTVPWTTIGSINETGEDVRHIYLGVDGEDPIRVVDRLESFGDITFVWQPSADQRVRVRWAPSRAKRKIACPPFPEQKGSILERAPVKPA